MRGRSFTVVFGCAVLSLLALAPAASADVRKGTLKYRYGSERPRLEYAVVWSAVDDDTVKVTRVKVRVTNPERPDSKDNWVSVTIFVGGEHPGMGEASWNGHADWSTIAAAGATAGAPADASRPQAASGGGRDLKTGGAEVVWTTEWKLGSGVWKTRYVPSDQRRSERYETWIRVRFHGAGRAQYWYRITSPLG